MIRRVIVYKCSDIKIYKRLGSVRKGDEWEYFWRKLCTGKKFSWEVQIFT